MFEIPANSLEVQITINALMKARICMDLLRKLRGIVPRTDKNKPNTWIQALNDEFKQSIDNEIFKCIFFLPRLPLAFEK